MMPFEIIREQPKPREIRFGRSPEPEKPLKQEPTQDVKKEVKKIRKRGRVKMADKKLGEETGGPEITRQDDPGEQGAIGSKGENAPAQEKAGEDKEGE